jgi:hypothetical protein
VLCRTEESGSGGLSGDRRVGGGGEGAADATAETPGARASQFATEAESNSASLKKLRVR